MTGSFAAITATGAWYGAGLKTRQEMAQVRKSRRTAEMGSKSLILYSGTKGRSASYAGGEDCAAGGREGQISHAASRIAGQDRPSPSGINGGCAAIVTTVPMKSCSYGKD